MAKRKIDESLMKEMVSKGFNRRPETSVHNETASEDPLDSLPITNNPGVSNEEKQQSKKKQPTTKNKEYTSEMDMEQYAALFLQPKYLTDKFSCSISRKTMLHLRAILEDTGKTTTLIGLIDNILNHHLHEYKELINKSTVKNIRKQTLTNL